MRAEIVSSGPCYLCRLLSFRHFNPCPSDTVNGTICRMCLDTFPQAGDLVDSFHLPMPVAAKRHGLTPYKFRSLYTKRGITKWPYRLLRPPVASRLHFVESLFVEYLPSTQEPTAVTIPATVRVANLETALDGSVKQGNLIKRLSHLELNTTGEQGTGPVLERIAKLEAVLGVSGAPPGSRTDRWSYLCFM